MLFYGASYLCGKIFASRASFSFAAPRLAAFAVLSLAVAIAACTTIFGVIYTVLLASPIFKDSNRLVVIWESNKTKGIGKSPVAAATFRDWRENSHTLQSLELVAPGSPVTIMASGLPDRANLQYATPGLFKLLGVEPAIGRFFRIPPRTMQVHR